MTDPLEAVRIELSELKTSFEEGVAAILKAGTDVAGLRHEIATIRTTAAKRARWYRGMWALLAAASVTFFVIGRVDSVHAEHQQQCFQQWANATAHRTETISAASESRVTALDNVLDVRKRYSSDSPQARQAIIAAAAAGDAYEKIVQANPPIPSEQLFCTGRPPSN